MSRAHVLSPSSSSSQDGPLSSCITSTLQDHEAGWDKQVEALQQLSSVAKSSDVKDLDSILRPSFVQQIRLLSPHIAHCIGDLRSTLVKEACQTVQVLAETLGAEFVMTVGDDVIPALLRRSATTKAVIRDSSVNAAKSMFEHGVNGVPFFTARLLSRTVLDRKLPPLMRSVAAEFIGMILVEDCLSGLQVIGEAVEAAISGGCKDPDESVRAISRENWRRYEALDGTAAREMLDRMSPQIVALIEKEKVSSPRSARSSPRSPAFGVNGVDTAANRSNAPRRANSTRAQPDVGRVEGEQRSPKSPTKAVSSSAKALKPAQRAVVSKPPPASGVAGGSSAITKKRRAFPPRPIGRAAETEMNGKARSSRPQKANHPILARPPRRSVMPNTTIELNGEDAPAFKRVRPRAARRSVPVMNILPISKDEADNNTGTQAVVNNASDASGPKLQPHAPRAGQRREDRSQTSPVASSVSGLSDKKATSPAAGLSQGGRPVLINVSKSSPLAESSTDGITKIPKPKRKSPVPKPTELSSSLSASPKRASPTQLRKRLSVSPTVDESKSATSDVRIGATAPALAKKPFPLKLPRANAALQEKKGKEKSAEPVTSARSAPAESSIQDTLEQSESPATKPLSQQEYSRSHETSAAGNEYSPSGSQQKVSTDSPESVMSAKNLQQFMSGTKLPSDDLEVKVDALGTPSSQKIFCEGDDKVEIPTADNSITTVKENGLNSRKGRISYILGNNVSPSEDMRVTVPLIQNDSSVSHADEDSESTDKAMALDRIDQDLSVVESTQHGEEALRHSDEPLQPTVEPTAADIALLLNLSSQPTEQEDALSTSEIPGWGVSEDIPNWEDLVREMDAKLDINDASDLKNTRRELAVEKSEATSEKENEQPCRDATDVDAEKASEGQEQTPELREDDAKKDPAGDSLPRTNVSKSGVAPSHPAVRRPPSRKSVLPAQAAARPPAPKATMLMQGRSKPGPKQEPYQIVPRRKASLMPTSRVGAPDANRPVQISNTAPSTKAARPKLGAPRRSVMPGAKIELKSGTGDVTSRTTNDSDVGSSHKGITRQKSAGVTRADGAKRKPLSPEVQGVVDWLRQANRVRRGGWQERCEALNGFGEACKQLQGEQVGPRLAEDCVAMLGDFIQDMHHRVASGALDGLFFLLLCSERSSLAFQKALEKRDDVLRRILGLLGSPRENVRLAAGRVMQSFDVQFAPEVAVSLIMRALTSTGSTEARRGNNGSANIVADGRVAEMGCTQLAHAFERASASGEGFVWKTTLLESVLIGMASMKKDRRIGVRRGAARVIGAVKESLPCGAFEMACDKYGLVI